MKKNIWNDILNGIDEKNIDDAIDLLINREESLSRIVNKEFTEIRVEKIKPSKFAVVRDILCAAAAFAVIIGTGIFVSCLLSDKPDVSPSVTTTGASAGASRFASYDFSSYSDPIAYNTSGHWKDKPVPEIYAYGEFDEPKDRYGLVHGAYSAAVVTVKEEKKHTTNLIDGHIYSAAVHYTAFGEIDGTKDIRIFSFSDEKHGQALELDGDYLLILSRPDEEGIYRLSVGINSIYRINGDFTVTTPSPYEAASRYDGVSLADIVHDLSEAYSQNEKPSVEKIVDYLEYITNMQWNTLLSFGMPEFPDVSFAWSSESVTADGVPLFSGMPVWNVYLYDFNGDGKREICSTASFGSGVIDERVYIYDFANRQTYEYSDRMYYNFTLFEKDGGLWLRKKVYTSGNPDHEPVEETELRMLFEHSPPPENRYEIDYLINSYSGITEVTVEGEHIPAEQLKEYPIEERAASLKETLQNSEFYRYIEGLDIEGLTDLYCRAYDLARLRDGSEIDENAENAVLRSADPEYMFIETMYTSESYYKALLSAFTPDFAQELLKKYENCYSYNGALYCTPTAAGGDLSVIHREYSAPVMSEKEIVLRESRFCADRTGAIPEYDPAKRDEYFRYDIDIRLVMAESGWRWDYFTVRGETERAAAEPKDPNIPPDPQGDSFPNNVTPDEFYDAFGKAFGENAVFPLDGEYDPEVTCASVPEEGAPQMFSVYVTKDSSVYSITDGTVIMTDSYWYYGRMIAVESADGGMIIYAHLNDTDVNVGQQVRAGELIAYSGNTGVTKRRPQLFIARCESVSVYKAENGMTYLRLE